MEKAGREVHNKSKKWMANMATQFVGLLVNHWEKSLYYKSNDTSTTP